VMGASVPSVVKLLSMEYLILILMGIGIAAPVTYYGAGLWLQNYAYQVQYGAGMIVIPTALILTISLLTVSFKSVKAALANPVGSLRNE
jgi:putative ABC transport system permease protein